VLLSPRRSDDLKAMTVFSGIHGFNCPVVSRRQICILQAVNIKRCFNVRSPLTVLRRPLCLSNRSRRQRSSRLGICRAEQTSTIAASGPSKLTIDVGRAQVQLFSLLRLRLYLKMRAHVQTLISLPAAQITLESGEIGRHANGAVMLTAGETVG